LPRTERVRRLSIVGPEPSAKVPSGPGDLPVRGRLRYRNLGPALFSRGTTRPGLSFFIRRRIRCPFPLAPRVRRTTRSSSGRRDWGCFVFVAWPQVPGDNPDAQLAEDRELIVVFRLPDLERVLLRSGVSGKQLRTGSRGCFVFGLPEPSGQDQRFS
jgi:hypothetical protein